MYKYLLSFIIILFFLSQAYAKVIGKVGETYSIKEKDALEEIEERVKSVDWGKVFDPKKFEERIKTYKPQVTKLPKAKSNKVYTFPPIHVLEFDIPDGKGGILYPKGYSFNILDYVSLPFHLIFIDGTDKNQVKWVNDRYKDDLQSAIFLVDGSYFEVSEKLKRPVFYANDLLLERFKIKEVPSVVTQSGKKLKVEVFNVGKN